MRRLFDPDRHTALIDQAWRLDDARLAIEAIAADVDRSISPQGLWPLHPDDAEPGETHPHTQLYFGAAGVILGMHELAQSGFAPAGDYARHLPGIQALNREALSSQAWRDLLGADWQTRSWLMGDAGVLFARWRVSADRQALDELEGVLDLNSVDPSRELMWGAPGALLAAAALHARTGEERWARIYRQGADLLEKELHPCDDLNGAEIWTQRLYGRETRYLGLGHGFAGAALSLLKGRALLGERRWCGLARRYERTLRMAAVSTEEGVNWPTHLPDQPDRAPLLQQCHGAPGVITALAEVSQGLDDLLCSAGELVWSAGPLKKGAGFCHGTAGNGFALLKLFAHTGDELWLFRARRFAMHALAQSERERERHGRRRYSLWTGDVGLAVFLSACCAATARFPSLDL